MAKKIVAENIGPVPKVVITLPDGGGVVELLGRNGQGKTNLLEATERMLGAGKANVSNRDGTLRGSIEGLGVKLSVTKGGARRTGDLEVVGLEHRLDLATFIDPQIDNLDAADRRRIAALMALSGVTADVTRFHRLVGGAERFAELVDAKVLKMTDMVEIAKTVKVDLERAARQIESQADRELGEAKGAAGATEGLDMDAQTDPTILDAARDAAVSAHATLIANRNAAIAAKAAASNALADLNEFAANKAMTAAEAKMLRDTAAEDVELRKSQVNAIAEKMALMQKELDAAIVAKDHAEAELRRAGERLTEATNREKSLDGWRATIAAAENVVVPSDEVIAAAQLAVDQAKAAVDMGTLVRAARRAQAQAAKHIAKADELSKQALALRDAAKQTDEILSECVNAPGISVDGGRLVVTHPKRGATLFADLSMGERTRKALELGTARVGAGGILVLPQEFYESLDPTNRREVATIAKELKVTVITARAADGDLRSEIAETDAVAV